MTTEIIVNVPDAQLDFFKELLSNLKISFQTPVKNGSAKQHKKSNKPLTTEQQEFVDGLRQSFKEVEAHERGEIKLRSLESFLDELDREVETEKQSNLHLSNT
jgi:thymidylate kinase